MTGRTTRDLLAEFKEAGLGSLPGGGAEIFHPEVRDLICEHKADAGMWLRVHREAHELGLRTNATMLYGHIEKAKHRIDHLVQRRNRDPGGQRFLCGRAGRSLAGWRRSIRAKEPRAGG